MTKIECGKVKRLKNERMACVIHHVQMNFSCLNLHKLLTTSPKTKRIKLMTMDYTEYTLKFNGVNSCN